MEEKWFYQIVSTSYDGVPICEVLKEDGKLVVDCIGEDIAKLIVHQHNAFLSLDKLMADVMNISVPEYVEEMVIHQRFMYKSGHRYARQAAVDLIQNWRNNGRD